MCKTDYNLKRFGGRVPILDEKKDMLFLRVLNEYHIRECRNVWVIENMDDYCSKQLNCQEFFVSKLYYLLSDLYDSCEWMILWYGNEYDDAL